MTKKTSIEDIKGIVKCEPTDSVEEVRKLRGRENEFQDCEYRYTEKDPYENSTIYYCKNKMDKDNRCDNCKNNIHLICDNYVPKNDMCLLYFELGVSNVSQYDECAEKTIYNDKEHQRKWSN